MAEYEAPLRTIEIPEADRREIRALLEPALERGLALLPEGGVGVVYIDPPGVCVPVST